MKTKKITLKEAIYRTPINNFQQKLNELCAACNVSVATMYRWMNDPSKVKPVYRPILAKALGYSEKTLFN